MKFTLVSDLHIDDNKWSWDLIDECDINIPLVVAGDISNDVWMTCKFLSALKNRFVEVVFVAGNHDMYNLGLHQTRLKDHDGFTYPTNVAELYDHYNSYFLQHNIHFLDRKSVNLDGVEFVGATGWHDFSAAMPEISNQSQIDAWYKYISDSHWINWNSTPAHNAVYQQAVLDSDWIVAASKGPTPKKVVVTHHIPHRQLTVNKPGNPVWNALNGSFCNTLMEAVNDSTVRAWCFGHTHYNWDKTIGDIRYVCNPRGYEGEKLRWQPVEIEI